MHKMAGNKDHTWEAYKQKMKDKRLKKGKALQTAKGLNSGDLILQKGELVVQRLSAEVSGKAQKYNRHGPREFVSFAEEELSIPAIKNACEKHFRSLTSQGLVCDVLAGDQGPSCSSVHQIPDLKVVHVRFIKPPIKVEDNNSIGTKSNNLLSEPSFMVESPRKRRATSAHSSTPPRPKQVTPKSLTVTQMIKLGKLIKPSGETVVVDIYPFDFTTLSWSMLPRKVEFTIENKAIGEGGFRKAFKASSTSPGFSDKTWVVKRFLEHVVKEIEGDLDQSMESHTKKVIQMHNLSKNFADQLAETVKDKNLSEQFGPVVHFEEVYFGKLQETGECITIERYIEGTFEKYINNTGELCVPEANLIGQKAACLAHFSYEKSKKQLMVLDLQGSGHLFYDPEIASTELIGKDNEYMFCAGNLSTNAITTFFNNHKCNMFCNLIGLK